MFLDNNLQACDLIIFGAKGDLARRKLIPALYQLEKNKKIHKNSRIIGVGRANWDKFHYIEIVFNSLKEYMKDKINTMVWNKLSKRINFCNLDVNDTKKFIDLKNIILKKNNVVIYYFAVSPDLFSNICKGLGLFKLNIMPARVIIEKPLGHSLKSAKKINHQVSKFFQECQIFRIDHYLGKETVLNLLALRFSNTLFCNNWDNKTIDHIQITIAEDVGIEGRWAYFDNIGQIRDMVQNHLLQILTIITMEPPKNLSADSIRDEKVKILKSLRKIDYSNVKEKTVRGQYTKGMIKGKKVFGYLEETSCNIFSKTETFVAIEANIDNSRWMGVPFFLRSGKRLQKKCSEIVIYFKNPTINLFKDSFSQLPQNKLIIHLQPNEGIDINILNKIPGLEKKYDLQEIQLNLSYSKVFNKIFLSDAYERLLLESMNGIQSLFVRIDEVEEAWKWIDSIINAWYLADIPLNLYEAGTWGPKGSINMINKKGKSWNKNN